MASSIGAKAGGVALGALSFVLIGLSLALGVLILFFTDSFVGLLAMVMPLVQGAISIGIALSVLVGLPLLIFRRTRPVSAIIFTLSQWVVGIGTWMFAVFLVYGMWGKFATLLCMFLGPLIFPAAAIAAMIGGFWEGLGSLALSIVVWFLLVFGTAWAANNAD